MSDGVKKPFIPEIAELLIFFNFPERELLPLFIHVWARSTNRNPNSSAELCT